jgi:hypothetical protein
MQPFTIDHPATIRTKGDVRFGTPASSITRRTALPLHRRYQDGRVYLVYQPAK